MYVNIKHLCIVCTARQLLIDKASPSQDYDGVRLSHLSAVPGFVNL